MADNASAILERMLERLYASLVQGPCLNCRPHSSRQRVDLAALEAFRHLPPGQIVPELLTGSGYSEVLAKVPVFQSPLEEAQLSEVERAGKRAFESQARLLGKLRDVAEDARDYEQETGENALYIGYPLLSVPPGADALGETSGRVLAPLGLIPVELAVSRGARQSVDIKAKGAGVDLVVANFPLLAWLEQQTGRDTSDLFVDEVGAEPWREINEIVRLLAEALKIQSAPTFAAEEPIQPVPRLEHLPAAAAFLNGAVLGLFPVSNQGLLRDMKAMVKGESLTGPIGNFLSVRATSGTPAEPTEPATPPKRSRCFREERLISDADPCQARAVRLAKETSTLVIHGPPGTGKSQTIANVIGDHLSRGERVLLVCDKRTALDVVQNRLEHLALGDLCAVVHDPQRDQRALYMKIRDQLDKLVERKTDPEAEARLRQTDEELQRFHLELSGYFSALAEPPEPGKTAFHDLVGEWLGISLSVGVSLDEDQLGEAGLTDFAAAQAVLGEVLERARQADYTHNPWVDAAGLELGEFLSRPNAEFRKRLEVLEQKMQAVDATWHEGQPPLGSGDLGVQGRDRERLAELLVQLDGLAPAEGRSAWFAKGPEVLRQARAEMESLGQAIAAISTTVLEPDLRGVVAQKPPGLAGLNQAVSALQQYDQIAGKWYGFVYGGRRNAAQAIATPYGLAISPENSRRLQEFFQGLKARLVCQEFFQRVISGETGAGGLMTDAELLSGLESHQALLTALQELHAKASPELMPLMAEGVAGGALELAEKLKASAARARALADFLVEIAQAGLFDADWLGRVDAAWRAGQAGSPDFAELVARFDTVETILRLRVAWESIPESLRAGASRLVRLSADPEDGLLSLRKALLAKEISGRIRSDPVLQQIDQERMGRCFQRCRELEANKRILVRDAVLHQWVSRQKARLLASTGTQLNADGTALKRRLLTRGQRAMKLRQMILSGAKGRPPDPLFDMCPVWMASPGTVAQIFPRQDVFDVIIFDEASQCRLEEALPVLTRGRRVVIAGDPKQLPPTRFFEMALVESESQEAETEQELFEQQQGEIEDLLTAALNIEARQCYLDVHYRSHNEGLIGFSNKSFYQDRLQPIPGHPSNRARQSPIRLIRADGVYERRGNMKEAAMVCDLVAELLARPEPPSIGVACFNLTQRDIILDALEARCERDPDFAGRLEAARGRRGRGSFEGLFVKNLENVQGDERDHMIISTTFGPDAGGKFRRNFGPVGRVGGGRRLNVLVTRAREMIHVVTSIPRAEYLALPKLEPGLTPGGRWLLYAYLHYAETLDRLFQDTQERTAAAAVGATPAVHLTDGGGRSVLAMNLAQDLLEEHALCSDVAWGNEGFCVDIAVRHPLRPEDVTIGVLCDMSRYSRAADPVEWDLFRTSVLEKQGWKFHRTWSPALFANPDRQKQAIVEASRELGNKATRTPPGMGAAGEPEPEIKPGIPGSGA